MAINFILTYDIVCVGVQEKNKSLVRPSANYIALRMVLYILCLPITFPD